MKRAVLAYWSDDTAPDLSDILAPHRIDAEAFTLWLGERLGDYRGSVAALETKPTRDDELQFLATKQGAITEVLEALGTESMPWRSEQPVDLAAQKMGQDWSALCKRLRADLTLARAVLQSAGNAVQATPDKRGRPAQIARAELLRCVIERLHATPMKKDLARVTAAVILDRCGIDVPLVKGPTKTRGIRKAEKRRPSK
jgi:hypothetical protein